MKHSVLMPLFLTGGIYADTFDTIFSKSRNEGYIRFGYQHDSQYIAKRDIALGGKLKYQTAAWQGIKGAVAFYTTQGVDSNDNIGIPFYDNDNHNYTLLGEAYLKGHFAHTTLTLGRQVLDTPFADSDDIGMIPNLFEACTLLSNDFPYTTLIVSHVSKWAGVDAPDKARFGSLNPGSGLQMIGVVYEGVADSRMSTWYYHAKNIADIGYLEGSYAHTFLPGSFVLEMQYVVQDFGGSQKAEVFGMHSSFTWHRSAITLAMAYNRTYSKKDAVVKNFWGGGPFYAAAEHLTPSEAGVNGRTLLTSVKFDMQKIGIKNMHTVFSYLQIEGDTNVKADEQDVILIYDASSSLTLDLIYSNVIWKEGGESFKNLRAFVNYRF